LFTWRSGEALYWKKHSEINLHWMIRYKLL
jgi:hypothetical protein